MTTGSCRGCRRSTTRTSRAACRRARCWPRWSSSCSPALLVAATFFWLGRRDAVVDGPPELIRAEPGPYKIKPPNPGGLDVAGESETAFETSAGEDKDSQLDLSKVPSAGRQAAPKEPQASARRTDEGRAAPKPAPSRSRAARAGSVVQLGAFQNQAQAERAWTALSARFPSVAAMSKLIVPFSGGIRLRAAAARRRTRRRRARR